MEENEQAVMIQTASLPEGKAGLVVTKEQVETLADAIINALRARYTAGTAFGEYTSGTGDEVTLREHMRAVEKKDNDAQRHLWKVFYDLGAVEGRPGVLRWVKEVQA